MSLSLVRLIGVAMCLAFAGNAMSSPPSVTTTLGASTIAAGGSTTLSFTVSNPNAAQMSGVGFSDTLPTGVTVSAPNNLTGSCSDGAITAVAGSGRIALTGATLAASAQCTFAVNVKATTIGVKKNVVFATATAEGAGASTTTTLTVTAVTPQVNCGAFSALSQRPGVGSNPVFITNGDFNGDGKLDLLVASVAGGTGTTISVLLGNGDGTFTSAPDVTLASPPQSIAVGDFDGDGHQDIAIAESFHLTVMRGNGDGTFTTKFTGSLGGGVSVAAGDLNGDGKLDLVLVLQGSDTVAIYLGNGDGTFGSATTISSGGDLPTYGTLADFNNDGKLDLLVVNEFSNTAIRLGNGDGTFGAVTASFADGSSPTSAFTGDFDGDGNIDIVIVNYYGGAIVPSVFRGLGDGTFSFAGRNELFSIRSVVAADVNGDGILDLVTADFSNGAIDVYIGNGDATFSSGTAYTSSGNAPRWLTAGDFNGNGRTDFAVVNNVSNDVSVFLDLCGPSIGKSFSDATIAVNNTSTLSFTINNPNLTTALNGVSVTDPLPSGLVIASPNAATGSCGGGTIADDSGSNTVSLTGATLPAGGSCTFSVNVQGVAAGVQNNTTSNVTATDVPTGNVASASIAVVTPPSMTMSFLGPIAFSGNQTSLSFTINNPNEVALSGLSFSDTLPAGLVVSKPNGLTGSCGGTVLAAAGSGTITLRGGTVAANSSCTFTVNIRAKTIGVKNNTAILRWTNVFSAPASATVTVNPPFFPSYCASFNEVQPHNPVGFAPATFATGDFNGDGKLDLVVGDWDGTVGNTIAVMLGNGDGTFGAAKPYTVRSGPRSIAVADFDGDGIPDLAVAQAGTHYIAILIGQANGTFQSPNYIDLVVDRFPQAIVAADFDGDGIPDLATTNTIPGGCDTTVLLGNGDGSFRLVNNYVNPGSDGADIAAGDFNGDGRLDLLIARQNGMTLRLGNGDGTFGSDIYTLFDGGPIFKIATGDFNGDGFLDFALTSYNLSYVQVRLGNGDGTFQTQPQIYHLPAGGAYDIVAGDFDGDGKLDLAIAHSQAGVLVAGGNGDGTFSSPALHPGDTFASLGAGDFDGDGSPDLAANDGLNNVTIFMNRCSPSIVLSVQADPVRIHQDDRLTFTIENPNPGVTLTGMSFTTPIDPGNGGVVVSTPSALSNTCGGTATATDGGASVSLTGGTLSGGATCTVSLNITATAAGAYTIQSGPISTNETGQGGTNNLYLIAIGPPVLTEAFSPSTVTLDGTATLTFTLTNPNYIGLSGVGFTDSLPSGLAIATPSNYGGNCSGVATPTSGGGTITMTNATLSVLSTCSFHVDVLATTLGAKLNTTSTVSSNEAAAGDPAQATLTVTPVAPTNVTATVQTAYSVLVTWTGSPGAASYEVFRSTDAGATFTSAGTTTETSLPDGLIPTETAYLYVVRAIGPGGASPPSAADLAVTIVFVPPTGGVSLIERDGILALRRGVNALRHALGMGDETFAPINVGDPIIASDIGGLRTELDSLRLALHLSANTYTDPLPGQGSPIRASTITDLQKGMQ